MNITMYANLSAIANAANMPAGTVFTFNKSTPYYIADDIGMITPAAMEAAIIREDVTQIILSGEPTEAARLMALLRIAAQYCTVIQSPIAGGVWVAYATLCKAQADINEIAGKMHQLLSTVNDLEHIDDSLQASEYYEKRYRDDLTAFCRVLSAELPLKMGRISYADTLQKIDKIASKSVDKRNALHKAIRGGNMMIETIRNGNTKYLFKIERMQKLLPDHVECKNKDLNNCTVREFAETYSKTLINAA